MLLIFVRIALVRRFYQIGIRYVSWSFKYYNSNYPSCLELRIRSLGFKFCRYSECRFKESCL